MDAAVPEDMGCELHLSELHLHQRTICSLPWDCDVLT